MNWPIRSVGVAVFGLTLLGGGACSHDGSSATGVLGATFQRQAGSVCRSALAKVQAEGKFPYPAFNPTQPDVSMLPMVAAWQQKLNPIYTTWLSDMTSLGQPPTGRTRWDAVVSALRDHVRITDDQISAALRGDAKTFTKDYYLGGNAVARMRTAAGAAGVPACYLALAA
jgi:hypothetical protein